jgi:hypothetical protein
MITTRQSGARHRNQSVAAARGGPSNAAWIASRAEAGSVLLLGGSNVIDFRIRVAQSHLRGDLLPSFWSAAGIIVSRTVFLSVPIDERLVPEIVPSANAIHECRVADYDSPLRYPNVAVLSFASQSAVIVEYARRLQMQRSAIDLPQLLVPWLAFVWGAGEAGNPLLQNVGVPSASLVETVFAMGGIELTPGVASGAGSPEAIWQSAIWWHDYYRRTAEAPVASRVSADSPATRDLSARVPTGQFVTRQPAAAVVEAEDIARLTARGRRLRRRRR